MFDIFALLGLVGLSAAIVVIVLALIFVFELMMFIDVLRNTRITDNVKIWWVVGMLLIHPFVAIAYYFTDYQK